MCPGCGTRSECNTLTVMLQTALLLAAVATVQVPDTTRRGQTSDASASHPLAEAQVTSRRSFALTGSAPAWRVSAPDIRLRGATTLTEVLRTLPGISVKDYGGIGGLKTVSIRTFGAQHTAVAYDGNLLSDSQNGQVDIGRINLDHLHSVRVDVAGCDDIFRPARLASYAGAVSLTSQPLRTDDGKPRTSVQMRAASFATLQPHVAFSSNLGQRWAVGLWTDYLHSQGDYPFLLVNGNLTTKELRLNSQVSTFNAEATARGTIPHAGTLTLRATAYDSSRGLPGSVVLYTQHPTEHLWDRTFTASARHVVHMPHWQMQTTLAYTDARNRYRDEAPTKPVPDDDRYHQQQASASTVALWHQVPHTQVSLAQDLDLAHLTTTLPGSPRPTRLTSHTALSAKWSDARLTAVATLLGVVTTDGYKRLLPTLGLTCKALKNSDLRLRTSYKESFRLPTFNDLYYLRVGNRNLLPERARQFNFGATWTHAIPLHDRAMSQSAPGPSAFTLTATADLYYNGVRDKIVAIPTMFIWHMRNVGRVRTLGSDLSLTASTPLAPWLTASLCANYSLQHAIDVTDHEAKNYKHQIPYTPRHLGNVVTTLSTPWINVSYTLSAVGERYSLAQNVAAYRVAPYCDHTLSLNHTFGLRSTRLHISAEALNLAGRNYEIVKYYPMPGRHFRLTLCLDF